jgi:hypothetical protein
MYEEGFWWGNLLERDYLEALGVDWRTILRLILQKLVQRACTGLIWLKTGTGDMLL